MSNFKFACPHCAQRLRCDERHTGRQILCPKCRQAIVIPAPSSGSLASSAGLLPGDSRATISPELTLPPVLPSER
jgi:hypothetical protein